MIEIPAAPQDIGLPERFTSFRAGQVIAAMRVAHAFETHDDVFLQAPPGTGKTMLSLLLAHMTAPERTYKGKLLHGGTTIATMTKLLQQQYLDEFPANVVTATGRDNWGCLIDPEHTAATAPCTNGWECPVRQACPYIKQRNAANEAPVSVLNTAFYIYERAYAGLFKNHGLTVFDEAHQLEAAMLGFGGKYVSAGLFRKNGLNLPNSTELRPDGPWAAFWKAHGEDILEDLEDAETALKETLEDNDLLGAVDVSMSQLDTVNKTKDLKKIADIMYAFKTAFDDPTHWVLSRDDFQAGNYKLRPVWGYTLAPTVLPSGKRLYMSGTILSSEFLAFAMGIENAAFVDMPSEFPARQRPLYYVPTVKMSAKITADDEDHMVRTMDDIIQARHLGQKGIIHTVSYKLRDMIMRQSRWGALMVTHNAADRLDVLETFRTMPDGHILVSPSMHTGVDLPEDQCRWQMIPKMPFPYLGDDIIRMRKADDRRIHWAGRDVKAGDLAYAWETAAAIVQAYGRAMRSETDWGYTYILDSNFGPFAHENRWGRLFPDWFREAIQYTEPSELGVN